MFSAWSPTRAGQSAEKGTAYLSFSMPASDTQLSSRSLTRLKILCKIAISTAMTRVLLFKLWITPTLLWFPWCWRQSHSPPSAATATLRSESISAHSWKCFGAHRMKTYWRWRRKMRRMSSIWCLRAARVIDWVSMTSSLWTSIRSIWAFRRRNMQPLSRCHRPNFKRSAGIWWPCLSQVTSSESSSHCNSAEMIISCNWSYERRCEIFVLWRYRKRSGHPPQSYESW